MMADMLYKVTKYMNVEDAMIARKGRPKTRQHPSGQRKKVYLDK